MNKVGKSRTVVESRHHFFGLELNCDRLVDSDTGGRRRRRRRRRSNKDWTVERFRSLLRELYLFLWSVLRRGRHCRSLLGSGSKAARSVFPQAFTLVPPSFKWVNSIEFRRRYGQRATSFPPFLPRDDDDAADDNDNC